MAETILSVTAEGILRKISSLILSEISLAWGVKTELKKLQSTLSTINAVLLDAELQQAKNYEVRDWLEKLKDVVYDAEDALDEFSTDTLRWNQGSKLQKIGNFFSSSSNPILYRFKIGHKIKDIRENLDDISSDKNKFHFNQSGLVLMRVENRVTEQTYSFLRESNVIGRERDRENIVEHLLSSSSDESLSVIPIVGLGGLGKTTLAQFVYNDERIVRNFDLKMWACVSVEFDLKKLVEKILKCIRDANYGHLEMQQMTTCLRDNLHSKRFLLVLDDVWNENKTKWTELRDLLMNDVGGSKIIVTTRNMEVAKIMGTIPPYMLRGLSDVECLSIFVRCAFKEGREKEHARLIDIGKTIISKCGGIPLAVRTLGCMLFMKIDEREWCDVRDNEFWKLNQNDNDILPALKMSYEQLPSYLKKCFSYCSIFSKDHTIVRTDLINHWMAQGLLQSPDGSCQLEDIGNRYFNELLSRSFFQDANVNNFDSTIVFVKMHDLVHDLAQLVASTECVEVDFNSKMISNRVRHVSFTEVDLSSNEFPKSLVSAKKVRSFSFAYQVGYTSKPFIDTLISSFRCMRSLDLSNSEFEELPDSIGNLKHLRYLHLSYNRRLKALPNSICKLLNLQTLKLYDCEQLKDLPKDIWKLISLRYLRITSQLVCLPEKGLQTGLTSLQFLSLYKCNDLTLLPEGIRYFTSLRELCIFECPSLTSLPGGLKYLTALEEFGIWDCQELNLLESEDLQGLTSLRTLSIVGLPKLQALPKGILQSSTSTLEYFVIGDCQGLTTLPEWMQSLASLQVLYILECRNLMSLPEGIEKLTNLKKLSLEGSEHLIRRCEKQIGEDWPKVSHVPQILANF